MVFKNSLSRSCPLNFSAPFYAISLVYQLNCQHCKGTIPRELHLNQHNWWRRTSNLNSSLWASRSFTELIKTNAVASTTGESIPFKWINKMFKFPSTCRRHIPSHMSPCHDRKTCWDEWCWNTDSFHSKLPWGNVTRQAGKTDKGKITILEFFKKLIKFSTKGYVLKIMV